MSRVYAPTDLNNVIAAMRTILPQMPDADAERFLTAPNVYAYVDDAPFRFCAIEIETLNLRVSVRWLAPIVQMIRLRSVFRAAMLAALAAHPEAVAWEVYALFPLLQDGANKATAWQTQFGGSSVTILPPADTGVDGYARISMAHFGDACAVVQQWPQ